MSDLCLNKTGSDGINNVPDSKLVIKYFFRKTICPFCDKVSVLSVDRNSIFPMESFIEGKTTMLPAFAFVVIV